MDIGFAPNYTNVYLIDTTPASEPTWAYVGPGISSVEPDDDEETDDTAYYDGGGVSSEDVTGVTLGYSISGNRRYGDAAQDYIVGLRGETGQGRVTHFRHVSPDGAAIEGECVVRDITIGGGDANDKGDFEFGVTFRGRPIITEPTASQLPESVSAQEVSVAVGETASVSPTVTPDTASGQCLFAVEDPTIATVDGEGNVKGVKAGSTQLSVKCAAKPSFVAVVKVTVTAL